MIWILWALLALFAAWLIFITVRAVRFKPPVYAPAEPDEITVDAERAVRNLADMIRCRTVSYTDEARIDAAEFDKFRALLAERYPAVFRACTYERIGKTGLLFRLPGKSSGAPCVFMAHYDVVPVDEVAWEKPPFDGVIENGELWGRGTLDTKATLLGVLEAAEQLICDGFVPKNDLCFAFAGDEEIAGFGAPAIVETFTARGVKPALVLDEGGAIVKNVFPGVKQPCALVGIAEKGLMDASFTIENQGGHASAPPPHTSVGLLAQAVSNVENHPFPVRFGKAAREMFDTLGRHSSFFYRLIFANMWCFLPLLDLLCRKKGGEMNGLLRTTCAFTMMEGSNASNVLPPRASVTANLRIITGETPETALRYLERHTGSRDIRLRSLRSMPPSHCSETEGPAWERIRSAIERTWPGSLVSPYLMIACSDARHYNGISDHVYRFCAMELSDAERKMIHGNNERIPVEKIGKTVAFYLRLMRDC